MPGPGPFRVERDVRLDHNSNRTWVTYSIHRTGDGKLCHTDDVTFAYRLVDLLNADEITRRDGTGPKHPS